jgi:hypothetical protein
VLLPDNLKLPVLINPGDQQSAQLAPTESAAKEAKESTAK